ncbi:MAG TPA: bifunctional DNA-formamidopyrimidine glycosylase/DNA-(apurinic or apyrimidinic site) lyase [Gammaproteobacteria bacterium]
MPELPEVETTRRGIAPHVTGAIIRGAEVRQRRLRWPVPAGLSRGLRGQRVIEVGRRGKYLLLKASDVSIIVHLGMSGSLRLVADGVVPETHDHVDVCFENGLRLRLRDPRRFGAVLMTRRDPLLHPLIKSLGPEPLTEVFDGYWLRQRARGRRAAIKNLIMDSHIVAGVGNIYASEALFMCGIHPRRQAGRISLARQQALADAIKRVLSDAIELGGTTLRDFVNGSGEPGYFSQRLLVYGRQGEPCVNCRTPILQTVLGQRASYYCPRCQR